MSLRYQEVKLEIEKIILHSKTGSKIPSRNFLSRRYEVARNTVDKAISELEREGWLNSVKGSGTYVAGGHQKRALNIGVILPSILEGIYPQLIFGVEQYASDHNINIVLSNSDNFPEKQRDCVQRMIEMNADGCIIVPSINSEQSFETFLQLREKGIPFVICNRYIDGLDVPFIGVNNYCGSDLAVQHLIDQGCERISYFSRRKYSVALERYYGLEAALLRNQGKAERGPVLLGNYGEEEMQARIRRVFEGPDYPDGALCFDDEITAMVYVVLQELGLQPGQDVKLVGNNDSEICMKLPVPLSSVSSKTIEMGKKAMEILEAEIGGAEGGNALHLIHPELVVRESSAPVRGKQEGIRIGYIQKE